MPALLDHIRRDAIAAIRSLSRSPSLVAISVGTMVVLIAGVTVLASLIVAVIFDVGPNPVPEGLVSVQFRSLDTSRAATRVRFPYDDFVTLRGAVAGADGAFDDIAALRGQFLNLVERGQAFRLNATRVTASIFEMYGNVPALFGRGLTRTDERHDADLVVVLSEDLWTRQYGADPSVVGRVVTIDEWPHRIVGVMPRTFKLSGAVDAWTPMRPDVYYRPSGALEVTIYGRMRHGVTPVAARERVAAAFRGLAEQHPDRYAHQFAVDLPTVSRGGGAYLPRLITFLACGVGLLVLAGCMNVAALLLGRATTRMRDVAVRLSLGATAGALIRQQVVEASIISGVATLVGVWIARSMLPAVEVLIPEGHLPAGVSIALHWSVFGVMAAVLLMVTLLCALAPAWFVTRLDPEPLLRQGARSAVGPGTSARTWKAFVAGEVAVAMLLLVLTAVAGQSLWALRAAPIGFDPDRLLSLSVVLANRYPEPEQRVQFVRQVLARFRELPGIEAASVDTAGRIPVVRSIERQIAIEGRLGNGQDRAMVNLVGADYLRTLAVPIRRGREIASTDETIGRPVAVVNEAFARAFFEGREPIGRTFQVRATTDVDGASVPYEIVGVSADVGGPEREIGPEVYVPFSAGAVPGTGSTSGVAFFLVRTTGPEPRSLVGALQRELWSLDPEQPFGYIRSAHEERKLFSNLVWAELQTTILSLFGVTALLLAAGGVYGIQSFRVSREMKALGVRTALGASASSIVWYVLGRGLRPALVGIISGAVLAAATARTAQAMLVGITGTTATAYVAATVLLLGVSAVACYLPARRAARVDPIVALQAE